MGVAPLSPASLRDLWRHARELAEQAETEVSPPAARRALVVLAVAGAGGDLAGFEREVIAVHRAFRALGIDPVPVFDAASALVADEELEARGVLVTLPRREAPPPRKPFVLG